MDLLGWGMGWVGAIRYVAMITALFFISGIVPKLYECGIKPTIG